MEEKAKGVVEQVKVESTQEKTVGTEARKQKISVSFTVQAFSNNVNRLVEAKMITEEEKTQLNKITEDIIKRWIGGKLAI